LFRGSGLLRIGFHVSIVGSIDEAVDRAVELGCNTFQVFTRNPRSWKAENLKPEEAEAFIEKVEKFDMQPVFAHMPYLANLASARQNIYSMSVETLKTELERCRVLRIPYLVTHLGSHLGAGKNKGFERIIRAIDERRTDPLGKELCFSSRTQLGRGTAWAAHSKT